MKKYLFKYCLLLFTVLFFTACYDRNGREQLARAQALLQQYPDSAANTLDSILQPGEMGKEYHMQFLITRVQAKYKAYRDIKRDTAVFEAVDYYTHKNKDPKQIALAYYSAGCVVREQGNKKESIPYFKNALEAASKTDDYTLQGLILENLAYLYGAELLQEQAIEYYRRAYDVYRKDSDTGKKRISALSQLALNFLTNRQSDSALYYFDKCKSIAVSIDDKKEIASLLNDIGIAYRERGEYEKAVSSLNEALQYQPDKELINRINLNLASNYLCLNRIIDIEKYLDDIKQSLTSNENLYYKSAVLTFLTNYEKEKQNFGKALVYSEENKKNIVEILNVNQSKELIDAEKQFDYTQKEMETEKVKLRQRNTLYISVSVIVLILMLFFVFWYLNLLKQRNKELELLAEKQRQETEKKVLEGRIKQYDNTNSQYKMLIQHTQGLHKDLYDTAETGLFKDKSDKFEKIIQALDNTEEAILNNMSQISRAFFSEQRLLPDDIYSSLTNDDVVLLYLLYIKEKRADITILLNIKPHTLTQRITRLKEKLNPLLTEAEYKAFFS